MTLNEFMENLSGMNDGGNFSRDILKPIFNSIKNEKLVWAQDLPADDAKVRHKRCSKYCIIAVRDMHSVSV